jgi:hypothetical protein
MVFNCQSIELHNQDLSDYLVDNDQKLGGPDNNCILITAVGDNTCSGDAKKTFNNILNEDPDINLFLGDSSYQLDNRIHDFIIVLHPLL